MDVGGKNHRAIGYLCVFLYLGDLGFPELILAIFQKDTDISWFMQQILLTAYSDC